MHIQQVSQQLHLSRKAIMVYEQKVLFILKKINEDTELIKKKILRDYYK